MNKSNFSWKTVWVFGGSFIVTFGSLWTFIEPLGGLCKLSIFEHLADCENQISIPYWFLTITSLIIALLVETIRQNFAQKRLLERLKNNLKSSVDKGVIEQDVKDFIINDSLEEIDLNSLQLNSESVVFLKSLFEFSCWLGLYQKVGNKYSSLGKLSPLILKSVFSSVSQSIGIFSGVSLDPGDEDNKKIRSLLKAMEEQRLENDINSKPIRFIESSIIIIKAFDENHEPRFLLQYNNAWNEGYFWWIGGIQENKDKNAEECARRELNEELGVKSKNIRNLKFEGTCQETIISDRVGALTHYNYNIFTITLKNLDSIAYLFKEETSITLPVNGFPVEREIKWLKWEEISSNHDLKRDAGSIIDFLSKENLHLDCISTEKVVHKKSD